MIAASSAEDTAEQPALLAAAFAVADSRASATDHRRREALSIDEASAALAELEPGSALGELHGRQLGLQVDGTGALHSVAFDDLNADGLPLFAMLRHGLQDATPGLRAGFEDASGGAELLAEWARGVLAQVVPGRAWRIEARDQVPAPARLATLAEEHALVRCLWVATDQLIEQHDADPMIALKLNARFVQESLADPERRLTAERLFPEVIEWIDGALPPCSSGPGARRAAWRQLPRELEQRIPELTLAALSRPAPSECTVHWHFD